MPDSLESARPILDTKASANGTAVRSSTYSASPSLTPSLAPSDATTPDPRTADIKTWNAGFDRLDDKRLASQRYVPSQAKSENLSKLALGAKLERALDRRYSSQDAVFTRRLPQMTNASATPVMSEKVGPAQGTASA